VARPEGFEVDRQKLLNAATGIAYEPNAPLYSALNWTENLRHIGIAIPFLPARPPAPPPRRPAPRQVAVTQRFATIAKIPAETTRIDLRLRCSEEP
jgi:hypothetical protein